MSKSIEDTRNRIFIYIATLFFFLFAISDLNVFLLKIPDFNKLNVSEGKVAYSPYSGKRGRSLLIQLDTDSLSLNCWISSLRDKTCVADNEIKKLLGKPAKVWWHEARINGFFTENRLLQFEVDGKTIISYQAQKQKYLSSRRQHDYLPTIFFVIFFFLSCRAFKGNK